MMIALKLKFASKIRKNRIRHTGFAIRDIVVDYWENRKTHSAVTYPNFRYFSCLLVVFNTG